MSATGSFDLVIRGGTVATDQEVFSVDVAPDVPTFAEAGVPGFEVTVWNAILAPAGVPRGVMDTLNASINRALKQPEARERLNALGLTPAGGTSADFAVLYKSEVARWRKVSKEAGVKIE